jgi:hypothetical protein
MPHAAVAVAMDPLGQYLAVSDKKGHVGVFDSCGQSVCRLESPRPLHHLAFVPEAPVVVGSADFGLVAGFDLRGRWLWRDGLVANVGSLAASGSGQRIVLACFSEGLVGYALDGRKLGHQPVPEACRLVALTYDGRLSLVAGLSNRLLLIDTDGRVVHTHALVKSPAALALGPLGDTAVVAQTDGPLIGLNLGDIVRT